MEHSCKVCGRGFSSLKAVWSHECRNLNSAKKSAHRSEKWEVSPKFDKHSKVSYSVEAMCKDIVTELLESCPAKCGSDGRSSWGDDEAEAPAYASGSGDAPVLNKSDASPVLGVWVADPTLPEGWKTCVISQGLKKLGGLNVSEKRMFYSPCGKLFTTRLLLDRFLEEQKKVLVQQNNIVDELKRRQVSSPTEVIRPADLCLPKMESLDCEDDASDAISLSDDDFEEYKEPQKKRKYQDDEIRRSPKYKKQKTNSEDLWTTCRLTPAQENILIGSYEEWPVAFPRLVDQLVKDTGLQAGVIEDWFGRRTSNCLRALFGSV